jgi:dipeptidyl aminopeptidase/acylaminoacyl peptidase
MNDHDARMLAAWFDASEVRGLETALDRALAAAKGTAQRPGWLVSVRGGTIAGDDHQRRSLAIPLFAATALIAALLTGALVGGLIVIPPVASPSPPSVSPSPSPTLPLATEEARGLVAYTQVEELERGVDCPDRLTLSCFMQRLWVADADGSNAHELLPGLEGRQIALGWSPDGRWLLFDADGVPTLTDASGSDIRPLDAAQSSNLGKGQVAFSPDSRRLAFFRDVTVDRPDDGLELAILDIASGQVVPLAGTRSAKDIALGSADWSPDGEWIVYERQGLFIPGKLFIVRPDGTDLRALTTNALAGIGPHWSPDGSVLAFTSAVRVVTGERVNFVTDIYTLGLVDRDPVRLTNDGISARPSWTIDGRIVFNRDQTGSGIDLWVMNADGSGVQHLDRSSLAALSESGCLVCVYPPTSPASEIGFDTDAFWQPRP